jgi:23S rRNA (adenine2503-C2)-methyltransferase
MPAPGELIMVEPKRPKPPKHWSDWTVEERKAQVVELGLPGFRADQFSRQWYQRLNNDTNSWTDVPAEMREVVKELLFPELMTSIKELKCDNGTTVKQVWKLFDGVLVESVLMRYTDRVTMCISSQAGCGMNCPFCATGQGGLTRNLSTAEIVEQVLAGARSLAKGEVEGGIGRVNNLVFMGMGEPMANYNSVIGAIRRLTEPAPAGFGMSARGITVSTVGLVPRMRQLAEEGIPVTLAVSLHAPDDELRDTLVPINTRYKVQEVLDAAWYYADQTGRRISIEYAMIRDINDQSWRADLLGRLLKNRNAHVNLIPLNPTPGSKWTASRPQDEKEFVRILEGYGVAVTVRDTRGREIDGACGQLAAAEKGKSE